ncbi:MAG TPA: hypothetical protein VGJ00_01955 [Rhabdochlamydiaceae bacterium]|jgi:hypothetical protein
MAQKQDYGHQAFKLLKFVFFIVPIIAGVDKFFNMFTMWPMYLSPFIMQLVNFQERPLMIVVGIVEIIAGIGVYFNPRIFSHVVFVWLILIIINLLLKGMFYDIALRDFGLALSALALAKLSMKYAK